MRKQKQQIGVLVILVASLAAAFFILRANDPLAVAPSYPGVTTEVAQNTYNEEGVLGTNTEGTKLEETSAVSIPGSPPAETTLSAPKLPFKPARTSTTVQQVEDPQVQPPAPSSSPVVNTDNCHPSYAPCIPKSENVPVCSNLETSIIIKGDDPYGLDGTVIDGIGCEENDIPPDDEEIFVDLPIFSNPGPGNGAAPMPPEGGLLGNLLILENLNGNILDTIKPAE